MKAKSLFKLFVPAIAVTMGVSSCQDYDANFSDEALLKEKYAERFLKDFGKVDPNHDWSMAGRFTATVNLDENVNGNLTVYTKEPGLNGSYILAKSIVENGKASVVFDAIKGSSLFYAVIEKNGRNLLASNYDVINRTITIGHSASTRALTTTAVADGVVATEYTISETNTNTGVVSYPQPWRMTKEAVAALVGSGKNSYKSLGDYNYWTGTNANQLNAIDYENLYALSNNHEEFGAEYTLEQLWKIFGKKKSGGSTEFEIEGVFQEGEDHIKRYVKPGILHRDASLVVAEDGPVSMELIWRGTDYYDLFGYFFYPSDGSAITAEYLWSTPKYILFGDDPDRPVGGSSNLTQVNNWNDALNNGEGGYNGWANMTGMLAQNTFGSEKTKMRGTKMWLVNFKDGQPTYEFEKGTKLGFFLYSPRIHQIVFSDTKLNYQLNYSPYMKGETGEEDNDQSRPYAVTFNYKGSTLLGFADGCNDYDINDVVFGAFNVEEVPDITPEEPEPEAQTWVVACEDLGGTFDYDFNDLVFGLRMTSNLDPSTSKLELVPLAAGGTLEAHILYDGEDIGEIHKLLKGASASTSTPYNVSPGSSPKAGSPVVLEKSIPSTTSIETITGKIKVKVTDGMASDIFIQKCQYDDNDAPQMILFHSGWDWPSEGTDIRNLYPDFADWVANSTNINWYKTQNPAYGKVISPLPKEYVPNSGTGGGNQGDNPSSGDNKEPGTGGDGPKPDVYNINLTECEEYNGNDWQGTQINWGYTIDYSTIDLTDAKTLTLYIQADQDMKLQLQSDTSWTACNQDFAIGRENVATNVNLTFNSVPTYKAVYFQTNQQLTNAKVIVTVTK